MSHFVYILYSSSRDKYYVGKSSDVERRLAYHNSASNKIWTRHGKPWVLKGILEFDNELTSSSAERFIKKQKSRRFIEKILSEGWKG